MKQKIFFTIVILSLILVPLVSSQEMVKIKGIAIDNLRNQMEGVSVSYQGQQSETVITDRNGIYQIDVPLLDDGENVIYLEFSKENYQSTAHVIYKRDGMIIVEEQDFDECYPQCNSADCQGPLQDAKPYRWEFETIAELEEKEFNANLYPFSNLYLFWDEPVTIETSYNRKNCVSPNGGGNSNVREKHVLGYAVPLSYETDITLSTQGGKETKITVFNDQFGKAIKVYKKGDDAAFEICNSQVCGEPKSNLILYIIIGVAVLVILIILVLIIKGRKKQVQSTNSI
tara:strand:+ start:104 stop:961 length:858 start_codon:yes stop_codon:yes gene_type:complete